MFATKCPGQDTRYWTAEDVHEEICPQCGEVVEFFKTDIRLRCRNCKTRVANPRFNMGCAEWCAHAEMCLGSAAKGINKKSFRTVLEEEFAKFKAVKPEYRETMKLIINKAEEKCRQENIDMLPVLASITILTLLRLNQLDNPESYLNRLAEEHHLPEEVVKETRAILNGFLPGELLDHKNQGVSIKNTEEQTEKVVRELLEHEMLSIG